MALKATIFKADLHVADMDRGYYGDHALTIARHPSENDERMMVRVLAFALHAHEALAFGKGIGADAEPDLWQRDLTGAVRSWIDVGQPEERRIHRACGRAARVFVYAYGDRVVDAWWEKTAPHVERLGNLSVTKLSAVAARAMGRLAERTMEVQCTIQEGQVWVTAGNESVQIDLLPLLRP
jgi:uncharacterized protein YaeQ